MADLNMHHMVRVWSLGDFVNKIAKETYNLIQPTIYNLTTGEGTMYECGPDIDEDEEQRDMYKNNFESDFNNFVSEDDEVVLEDYNQDFKLHLVIRVSNLGYFNWYERTEGKE